MPIMETEIKPDKKNIKAIAMMMIDESIAFAMQINKIAFMIAVIKKRSALITGL